MRSQNTQLYKKYRTKVKRKMPPALFQAIKKLAAISLLVGVGFVVFPDDLTDDINTIYTDQVVKLDFRIEEISIDGMDRLKEESLRELAGIKLGTNIMALDLSGVKSRLEAEPWVKSVAVERILPKKIAITIREETPQAVYAKGGKYFLVNLQGKIIQEIQSQDVHGFILVSGSGANLGFATLLEQLHKFDDIYKNIDSMHMQGERRWDIKLKNNILLKLPEADIYEALEVFEEYFGKISKLYKTCVVDLRLIPDKIYLKMIN